MQCNTGFSNTLLTCNIAETFRGLFIESMSKNRNNLRRQV